jgi:hypothetical protein
MGLTSSSVPLLLIGHPAATNAQLLSCQPEDVMAEGVGVLLPCVCGVSRCIMSSHIHAAA